MERGFIVRCRVAPWVIVLLAGVLLTGTASSQSAEFGPGVVPGEAVAIPSALNVLGRPSAPRQPALVVFTRLVPCSITCEGLHHVLTVWADDYPEIGIYVVSLRNTEDELRALAAGRHTPYLLFADSDGVWEAEFQTNLDLTMFLVDEQGIVRTRFHGLDPQRIISLDRIMALAAAGRWEEVDELAERPLQVGRPPAPPQGLAITPGQPTIVYFTDSNCIHCSDLIEQGLQDAINALASQYPRVRFVIMDRQYPRRVWDVYGDYVARFGANGLPEFLRQWLQSIDPESEIHLTELPSEGWQPNVEVIRYVPGDANDPGLKWGKHGTPDLAFFDEQGRFVGPDPFWMPGAFSPFAVATAMEQFILLYGPR